MTGLGLEPRTYGLEVAAEGRRTPFSSEEWALVGRALDVEGGRVRVSCAQLGYSLGPRRIVSQPDPAVRRHLLHQYQPTPDSHRSPVRSAKAADVSTAKPDCPATTASPFSISRTTKSWTRAYVAVTPASEKQRRGSVVQLVIFYPASTLPRERRV